MFPPLSIDQNEAGDVDEIMTRCTRLETIDKIGKKCPLQFGSRSFVPSSSFENQATRFGMMFAPSLCVSWVILWNFLNSLAGRWLPSDWPLNAIA